MSETPDQKAPTSPSQEAPTPMGGELNQSAKNLGMLCHLLGLVGLLGPLIIWLIKKEEHPFIDASGKESLNFQITVFIALIACVPLFFIFIGFLLMPLIFLADLILVIMAAVKTSSGQLYRYPVAIRLLK